MVLNRADLNLVTSPQMKDELEKNGIQRVTVWRKGVDIDVFNPAFRDTSMRSRLSDGHPKDTLLVYVGRLGAEKRIKDLKAVLEALPDVRLAIVGKGPQEQELREHFKGTKTVFTGELRGEDLSSAFASADVFCMPSDSETLGFVVRALPGLLFLRWLLRWLLRCRSLCVVHRARWPIPALTA